MQLFVILRSIRGDRDRGITRAVSPPKYHLSTVTFWQSTEKKIMPLKL